jgi:HPt (histidine-containing phosphotransfer) domain-containing protein
METSQQPTALKLNQDIQSHLDAEAVQTLLALLPQHLREERSQLNQAFADQDWEKMFFITENLFGSVSYFELPLLQGALKEAVDAACKRTFTGTLLDNLNQEIEAVLRFC